MSKPVIHPSAVVSPKAELGRNVSVGAYSVIGDRVTIGDDTEVNHHVVIDRNTIIGRHCQIFPFSSLGTDPQDITFKGEETWVHIGDNTVIREFTTINRGTAKGGGHTRVGNDCYLMAYVHVAHDCQIGNRVQLTNGATLGGHVEVEDNAVISAYSSAHQFVRIGRNAYVGGYTVITQDILPFAKVAQTREHYSLYGPNSIGMMRNGISRPFIENIKEIFRIIYRSDLNTSQAVEKIRDVFASKEEAAIILDFLSKSKRGILKNFERHE
jgi:UDP-N-acetylglucosamine acyltransferase